VGRYPRRPCRTIVTPDLGSDTYLDERHLPGRIRDRLGAGRRRRLVRDAGRGAGPAGGIRRAPGAVRPRHLGQQLPGSARAGRAFGVFGSVAAGGGAVGLILGGALTQYLSWRYTLYVNLVFAAIAITGALVYIRSTRPATRPRMDWPGAILACAGSSSSSSVSHTPRPSAGRPR
jgi:MFS family permease